MRRFLFISRLRAEIRYYTWFLIRLKRVWILCSPRSFFCSEFQTWCVWCGNNYSHGMHPDEDVFFFLPYRNEFDRFIDQSGTKKPPGLSIKLSKFNIYFRVTVLHVLLLYFSITCKIWNSNHHKWFVFHCINHHSKSLRKQTNWAQRDGFKRSLSSLWLVNIDSFCRFLFMIHWLLNIYKF